MSVPPERLFRNVEKEQQREDALDEQQHWTLNQDDEGVAQVPHRRGIAGRIRSVFGRGEPPARPPEAEVSEAERWEHERQHLAEDDEGQRDSRD